MMVERSRETQLRLIDLLPAIYQDPGTGASSDYFARFLLAFEEILWGLPEGTGEGGSAGAHKGLRQEIAGLSQLLDPWCADEPFLPWLAGWTALSLRPHMRDERKRELIANMLKLYRIRGTKFYLEELLRLCVDASVSVDEEEIPAMQVGKHSTVGRDSYIGGGPPHFFRVRILDSQLSPEELQVQRQLVYEVVELAKPAHTGYALETASPKMQIAVHSTVGIDTVIGPAPAV
jgi:phage tail-like protein